MAKHLTWIEASNLVAAGKDASEISSIQMPGLERPGAVIYRRKWTRIRPGLQQRLLGEYIISVEECDSGIGSCVEEEQGWIVKWTPIWMGNLSYEGRSEWPYRTLKEAKQVAERDFEHARLENPKGPARLGATDLIRRLKF